MIQFLHISKFYYRFIPVVMFILLGTLIPVSASDQPGLPYVIQLPENENAVIVEKLTQTFFVYSHNGNGWTKHLQVPCSTGEVAGIKLRAGDKKTPEGIYFAKDEYEDKYLTPVYGKKAFPIDYPNLIDKLHNRNGSAIWIHGTNKPLKPMDSNGCIALENENVVKLSDYIHLDSTPIILVDKIEADQNQAVTKEAKTGILNLINQWSRALLKGTYQEYLSFYSPLYLPEIEFWPEWLKIRAQLSSQKESIEIVNENTGIYYHNDVFVVLFDQVVQLGGKRIIIGKRKLFLSELGNGLAISGDVYQSIPDAASAGTSPLISLVEGVLEPQQAEEKVLKTVKSWLAAWSAKNMKNYADYYAANFYSDGMNKKQWVNRKAGIADKVSYINVTGTGFKTAFKDGRCVVTFSQTYESSIFKAKGTKQLTLIKTGGSWKIFQENWKKK